jgi:hypothetical protein
MFLHNTILCNLVYFAVPFLARGDLSCNQMSKNVRSGGMASHSSRDAEVVVRVAISLTSMRNSDAVVLSDRVEVSLQGRHNHAKLPVAKW